MTDKPIPFTAPMVRAIIEGRKTQTRRVLKPQPRDGWEYQGFNVYEQALFYPGGPMDPDKDLAEYEHWDGLVDLRYQPGQRLWVREAWRTHAVFDHMPPRDITTTSIHYEADGQIRSGRYRHARYMPRRMSRLTLTVTANKVQRLQEISGEEVELEGCSNCVDDDFWFPKYWDTIAKPGSKWADNPWVEAPEFTVQFANIDSEDIAA